MTQAIEYLDRPPAGWFLLDVLPKEGNPRGKDWVALIADVPYEDLKNCTCDFPALFLVHPKDYRPGVRKVHQAYFRIPGKHRGRTAAWNALEDMLATRH